MWVGVKYLRSLQVPNKDFNQGDRNSPLGKTVLQINPFTPIKFIWTWINNFSKIEYKTQTKYQIHSNFFEYVLYIFGSNSDEKD